MVRCLASRLRVPFACLLAAATIAVAPRAATAQTVTVGVTPTLANDASRPSATTDDGSIRRLGQSRINQFITTRVLGSLLLGANQQVNCGDCFSAYGAAGSLSGGLSGRYNLTDSVSFLAGAAVNSFKERDADVRFSSTFALSVRYDPAEMGPSRPFFEVGGLVSPEGRVRYTRPYVAAGSIAAGVGDTTATATSGFVRVGWVARLSPRDEFAVLADYSRGSQSVGRYTERAAATNPFAANVVSGTDEIGIARFGAQYTRLLTDTIEGNVNGALAYAFDQKSGLGGTVGASGLVAPRLRDVTFFEGGGRLGFRITAQSVIDVFAVTAVGPQPVGTSVHGGIGWRYTF